MDKCYSSDLPRRLLDTDTNKRRAELSTEIDPLTTQGRVKSDLITPMIA